MVRLDISRHLSASLGISQHLSTSHGISRSHYVSLGLSRSLDLPWSLLFSGALSQSLSDTEASFTTQCTHGWILWTTIQQSKQFDIVSGRNSLKLHLWHDTFEWKMHTMAGCNHDLDLQRIIRGEFWRLYLRNDYFNRPSLLRCPVWAPKSNMSVQC